LLHKPRSLLVLFRPPPMSTLSEDHISAPMGCCPHQFLDVLEYGQGLLTHLQPATLVRPKIKKKQFKGRPDFERMSVNTFGAERCYLTTLSYVTYREAGTTFCGPAPLKLGRAKKHPKFGAISDNFIFSSRISPARFKVWTHGERRYQPLSILRSGKTIW